MSAQPSSFTSPATVISADPETTAGITEAINFLLAAHNCPSEHRPLIDYIIGYSAGNTDWFEAADDEVGLTARPSPGEVSRAAACKWVQRARKKFLAWEDRQNVAFIECMPGGRDSVTKENFKSRYKVNLLSLAEETVREAQEMPMWRRDPRRALELTATEKAEDVPQTPARKDRFRPPRRDEEALLQRNPKTALTLLKEAAAILARRGTLDPEAFVEDFANQLREALALPVPLSSVSTDYLKSVDNPGRRDTGGAVPRPASRAKCGLCGIEWQIGAGHVCAPAPKHEFASETPEIGVDRSVHPPTQAVDAVELFASVGAVEFGVTLLHDPSPSKEKRRDYEVMSADELRARMPQLLEFNQREQRCRGQIEQPYSIVVRPEGKRVLWQTDDATQETCDVLRPVAFAIVETSPGSFQAWLAIDDELSEEESKTARERLLRVVERTGANGGSFGALRWPGSRNQKPTRKQADGSQPIVRIVHCEMGRVTTIAELDRLGLLAPPVVRATTSNFKIYADKVPTTWPSWEQELGYSKAKKDGTPNRSEADFRWCRTAFRWGWSEMDIATKLCDVSTKARDETAHYINRTVNAARAAAVGGAV